MEATCSSAETSVYFQQTTGSYIPEDETVSNHRFENLRSYLRNCYWTWLQRLLFCMKALRFNVILAAVEQL
jgi:hypothetical protein